MFQPYQDRNAENMYLYMCCFYTYVLFVDLNTETVRGMGFSQWHGFRRYLHTPITSLRESGCERVSLLMLVLKDTSNTFE